MRHAVKGIWHEDIPMTAVGVDSGKVKLVTMILEKCDTSNLIAKRVSRLFP